MTIAKKIVLVITVCVLIVAVVIALDVFNIATVLGFDVSVFQWDLLSIVIGNIVVIAIFIITYILIESNNVKRQRNQERSAKIILQSIYNQCQMMMASLEDSGTKKVAAYKLKGDIPIHEEPTIKYCQDVPFEYGQYIFEASSNGVLSESEFRAFLEIQRNYKMYVVMRLVFFDAETYDDGLDVQRGLKSLLVAKRTEILDMLKEQLNDLKMD